MGLREGGRASNLPISVQKGCQPRGRRDTCTRSGMTHLPEDPRRHPVREPDPTPGRPPPGGDAPPIEPPDPTDEPPMEEPPGRDRGEGTPIGDPPEPHRRSGARAADEPAMPLAGRSTAVRA